MYSTISDCIVRRSLLCRIQFSRYRFRVLIPVRIVTRAPMTPRLWTGAAGNDARTGINAERERTDSSKPFAALRVVFSRER
jgi:hypothetical protein